MSYNQTGGAIRQPARWFNNKNLYKGPNCQNCGCGAKKQEGGAVRMPARYFNDLDLYRGPNCQNCGCGSKKQEGGAVRMPARYFNDLDLYRGPNCDSCLHRQIGHLYKPCDCSQKQCQNQTGGTAIGAPFYIFNKGAPLKQSKPFEAGEGPVFDELSPSCHW